MLSLKNRKLLAVDPSLTQSGWAIFDIKKNTPKSWGIIRPEDPKGILSNRLSSIFKSVKFLLEEYDFGEGDILVCEGPAPISLNPSSAIKVEQVRCIFENIAREKKVLVPGRINPRSIHSELLGLKGKQAKREQVKEVARQVVKNILLPLKNYKSDMEQDEVDAILIGVLATSRANRANSAGFEIESMFLENQSRKKGGRGLRW